MVLDMDLLYNHVFVSCLQLIRFPKFIVIEMQPQITVNWNIINLKYTHFHATENWKLKWLIWHDLGETTKHLISERDDVERVTLGI